jgi:hypothetical protein
MIQVLYQTMAFTLGLHLADSLHTWKEFHRDMNIRALLRSLSLKNGLGGGFR